MGDLRIGVASTSLEEAGHAWSEITHAEDTRRAKASCRRHVETPDRGELVDWPDGGGRLHSQWHDILDRIVHNAYRLELDGPSMRKLKAGDAETEAQLSAKEAAKSTATKPASGGRK